MNTNSKEALGVSYGTIDSIPQNRGRCIQDTVDFGKSVKWHSNRFDRPRKDLGNKILQIDCSFALILIGKMSLKYCSEGV